MVDLAYELNRDGAQAGAQRRQPRHREDGKPRFVAGALGPTNRTASISPDVANPGYRAVTFDDLRIAYSEQINGLLDGGADLLLVETIFDTLNAKAALYAIAEISEARGIHVPVMISGTITDKSGRLLSGQIAGSVLVFGAARQPDHHRLQLRARRAKTCARTSPTSAASPIRWSAPIRTPACRTSSASMTRAPNTWRGWSANSPQAGLVNVVGGCCGTTPDHISAIAHACAPHKPRVVPEIEPLLRLSGLEPFNLTSDIPFVNVGERTNVTGSARFRKLIKEGDYTAALQVARDQVENGAQVIDVNMDEGLLDSEAGDDRLPQSRCRPSPTSPGCR